MSSSFPNSWEPYGSSQQSQAIAWRKPATRPANQPTLSARWKNAQANILQSSILPSRPTPSVPVPPPQTKPKTLDLASFHQAEYEHRVVARYESIRTEVRQVAASVEKLSTALDDSRQHHDTANKSVHDEIASLHGALVSVREQVKEAAKNYITDEHLKHTLQEFVTSLAQDVQALASTLDKVDDACNRISKHVNYLTNGLLDRITKRVSDDIHNVIKRQLIPVFDQRIQKMLDDHLGSFEALALRIEDCVKPPDLSYDAKLVHERFQPRFGDRGHEGDYVEERVLQRGTDGYATRSCIVREEIIRREEDERLALENRARVYRHSPDSFPRARATDFDVSARHDLTEGRPDSDTAAVGTERMNRGTQRMTPPASSTQDRSNIERGGSAREVWARVRIRPRRGVKKRKVASGNMVIDLTKSGDSDGGEEANIFEESQSQGERVAKKCPKVENEVPSQDSIISSLESGGETVREGWSPSEAVQVEKRTSRGRAYRIRHKSPYLTRSAKKRQRR